MSLKPNKRIIGLTKEEWKTFFSIGIGSSKTKTFLYLFGIILAPLNLGAAIIGYIRGYYIFMKPYDMKPELDPLLPSVKGSMLACVILMWIVQTVVVLLIWLISGGEWSLGVVQTIVLVLNTLLTIIVMEYFDRWRQKEFIRTAESEKFGSARFARPYELAEYEKQRGLYIGGGSYNFSDKGHILTVAGTRGGKGTNLIVPNLLGLGGFEGSFVVIDPKAELAAITGRYQADSGKNVVVLNPWDLLTENVGEASSYNPLDILSDISSPHLVDDADIIAEMIVPIEKDDKNRFFTDNSRAILSAMILHLVTTHDRQSRTLDKIWKWVRYSGSPWENLLAEMASNIDPVNGEAVRTATTGIIQLMLAGEKTFGNIMATLIQCTDFLKSPSLQQSLKPGFDPSTLSDGNTIVYIVIPVDKLKSHSRWLRLVTVTLMRAVVRKPDKRVCFLLDEFAALGYLSEAEVALSTYAGFNLTLWPILQSLIQLKGIYGDKWEVFVGNTAVKQYFSVNDNFTAKYISDAIGNTTYISNQKEIHSSVMTNSRPLVSPDEVRRGSGDNMFVFIAAKPPVLLHKRPYYQMEELIGKDGEAKYDRNPYF